MTRFAKSDHYRKQLQCDYRQPKASHRFDKSLNSVPLLVESRTTSHAIDFPSVLFLDPRILSYGQLAFNDTTFTVPTYILQMLGDDDEIQLTTSKYFDRIHQWMPFVSKKRLHDIQLKSSYPTRPDVVMLLLCMKLSIEMPTTDQRARQSSLYGAVKHLLLELERSSELSLPVLQSMVLLGLYEVGHAIYPAAFLTIGTCARYANTLGIGTQTPLPSRMVLTLVEIEERRRVWWAVVILDRFVSTSYDIGPFFLLKVVTNKMWLDS
jgi:hypothetical protein